MAEAKSLMTKELIKIKPELPIQTAHDEMKKNGIRHLPVIDMEGKLVGILSDRDVQRAVLVKKVNGQEEKTFNPNDTVEGFMSRPVRTVDETTSVASLAKMMIDLKVSAFVVNGPNDQIKGIITTEDLLKYLVELINSSPETKTMPISQLTWGHI